MKKSLNICEIYEISVVIDGEIYNKFYIGQSWMGVKLRFLDHRKDKKGDCPKLFNAMNKYGRENFYTKAILTVRTQKDADFFEDYFIKEYDSINNGYNIKEGGSNGKMTEESKRKISEANKGHKVSEATRFAVSLAHKGIALTEEHKAKISENVKGEKHPLWGTHQSELSKLKNSESNKKIYLPISEGGKGYIHPSTGKKKGPLSDETKRKLSEVKSGSNNSFFGKKHSLESIEKIKNTKARKKSAKQQQQFYASTIYYQLESNEADIDNLQINSFKHKEVK